MAHFNVIGGFDVTSGENFTCASISVPFAGNISCEILSLSQENTPAVVNCSAILCVLPVALDDRLFITIRWDARLARVSRPLLHAGRGSRKLP